MLPSEHIETQLQQHWTAKKERKVEVFFLYIPLSTCAHNEYGHGKEPFEYPSTKGIHSKLDLYKYNRTNTSKRQLINSSLQACKECNLITTYQSRPRVYPSAVERTFGQLEQPWVRASYRCCNRINQKNKTKQPNKQIQQSRNFDSA